MPPRKRIKTDASSKKSARKSVQQPISEPEAEVPRLTLSSLPLELIDLVMTFIAPVPVPYPHDWLTQHRLESFSRTKTLISLSQTCSTFRSILKGRDWQHMWEDIDFCRGQPSYPGTRQGLKLLRKQRNLTLECMEFINIVTSRDRSTRIGVHVQ
jgi:hypothetical protein